MVGLKPQIRACLLQLLPLLVMVPMILGMTSSEGSATAYLTGRSASGRTVFKAELQDISGMFEGGSIAIDDHVVEFTAEGDRAQHHVIWDPQNLFEGTEPRPDKGHATSSIRLNCRLEYRI